MADKQDPNTGRYLAVGLEVAIGVALGYGIGWWLDKRYGWSPWGVTVGAMLGLTGGLYLLIKDALRINKD
jgi:F0F1-type ATP synthase assembly protein I